MALSTGHLRHLRRIVYPHPLWLLGRPEVKAVVESCIDLFIPFDEKKWLNDTDSRQPVIEALNRRFFLIMTDIHVFYGGIFVLGPLLERLESAHRFIYEGYFLGSNLAPLRIYPKGFTVIGRRPETDQELTGRHILHHNRYYIEQVCARLFPDVALPQNWRPALPEPEDAEAVLRRFDLEPGRYVAWQPASNNPRKDYPPDRWREILAGFPGTRFVALGTAREGERINRLSLSNVVSLAGKTTLAETMALIRLSRLFIGPDSGLTHIAAIMGKQTVCVSQASNLGYFFPYPPEYGFTNLHTVFHPDYLHCSGCFMTCRYESIIRTYRQGARCLRQLPVEPARQALDNALNHTEGGLSP
jgi:hypothetical protein